MFTPILLTPACEAHYDDQVNVTKEISNLPQPNFMAFIQSTCFEKYFLLKPKYKNATIIK